MAGCLAHVRRKFYEARESAPKVAGWILRHFQNLYALEADLRKARAGPKLRAVARASLSQPMLARLHRALVRLKAARRFLPQSLMGKALGHALNQWPSLHVFLEDGRLEIDPNLVENAIRPTAVGKKNWLFIGDAQAGYAVRPQQDLNFRPLPHGHGSLRPTFGTSRCIGSVSGGSFEAAGSGAVWP